MLKKDRTKSPLKGNPLRNPGQSLDEAISRKINDEAVIWAVFVIFSVVLACLEWYRHLAQLPYTPWLYTVVAVLTAIVGTSKIRKIFREVKLLKLGRDGEKAVGQYLEKFRESGYRVFHDIQGGGFNIDHVIIGPTGVFSIETKTFSKPSNRHSRIIFDGNKITKDGFELSRDPIIQAKAQSKWLAETLEESTSRKIRVKPVVVFPGWFVESTAHEDVWVLNPKALQSFVSNHRVGLKKEDVGLLAFHLSRIVRKSV